MTRFLSSPRCLGGELRAMEANRDLVRVPGNDAPFFVSSSFLPSCIPYQSAFSLSHLAHRQKPKALGFIHNWL